MEQPTNPLTPLLETDPKSRAELKHWLERREHILRVEGKDPNTPLTAREYLMVQRLKAKRFEYSIT